jgi:hypothetical protein
MKAIDNQKTLARSWLAAAKYLEDQPAYEAYDVILEIETPNIVEEQDTRIEKAVDGLLRKYGKYPLFTVAETIFPGWLYMKHGPLGVYEIYPNEVLKSLRTNGNSDIKWGTYAGRMLQRTHSDGTTFNPLKECIEKMRTELTHKGPMRNCYELGFINDEFCCVGFDLPLYNPEKDRRIRLGGPCLSHISIKLTREKQVRLVALYRYHYYIERALGNLFGLARLQEFIANELELSVGPLVCHSSFAKLDHDGIPVPALRDFIASL